MEIILISEPLLLSKTSRIAITSSGLLTKEAAIKSTPCWIPNFKSLIVDFTKFLIDNGISSFAVATIDEALILRNAQIKEEILMLSSTAIEQDVRTLVENNIILTVGSKEDLEIVDKVGKELNKKIKVHLKIDTGFGRYGFIYNEREKMIEAIKQTENIQIEGTFTHFSVSFFDEKYTRRAI